MNHKLPAVATAAVLCAALTACGGDKKLSREKLASKAQTICKKADADAKKVAEPKNITDAADASKYFDKLAPIGDQELSSIKKLKPNGDAKDDWNGFVSSLEDAVQLIDSVRDKADKKDASGLQDLAKGSGIAGRVKSAAQKAGVSGCS